MQRNNFLFLYNSDRDDTPVEIILLEKAQVEGQEKPDETNHHNISAQSKVLQWMETEGSDRKKKGKLRNKSQRMKPLGDLLEGIMTFEFKIIFQGTVFLFCSQNHNTVRMWVDACTKFRPWWEELNFSSIHI